MKESTDRYKGKVSESISFQSRWLHYYSTWKDFNHALNIIPKLSNIDNTRKLKTNCVSGALKFCFLHSNIAHFFSLSIVSCKFWYIHPGEWKMREYTFNYDWNMVMFVTVLLDIASTMFQHNTMKALKYFTFYMTQTRVLRRVFRVIRTGVAVV